MTIVHMRLLMVLLSGGRGCRRHHHLMMHGQHLKLLLRRGLHLMLLPGRDLLSLTHVHRV